MKHFFRYFKANFLPLVLLTIVIYLAYANYVPGTWLSGWDTLHPEFNFGLYLKRTFYGVWQEHQGVGAVASQAHPAEIPRLFILYLISLVAPSHLVRYSFFFLTLAVGTLGVYYLTRHILNRKKLKYANLASFLASFFYLFNLATLQQYYVPFEMFAVHFATLPWLFYFATRFLGEGKRKDILWFCLATIFSSSIAHTPTLFYVYFAAFSLFITGQSLLIRKKEVLKRGALLILLTILLNLYWLLPNLYFLKNHSQDVTSSKIHTNFSDEAFFQSESFGNLKDLSLFKNFLFNWREYRFSDGKFVDLLDEWGSHLKSPGVDDLGYIFFTLSVVGIFISFFRKSKSSMALLPVLVLSVFFWLNANPPFGDLFNALRNIDLVREGLRFPFTKFSFLLTFTLSIYFAFAVQFLLEKLRFLKLNLILFLIIAASFIYFAFPFFKGFLISPSMKVNIPQEYFQAFDWFSGRSGRVAKLPLNSYWGWGFYSWGYQGAGFTWFGIESPTMDREFDRWSPENESFFNEASFALYANDSVSFNNVLKKYNVAYLLLDESLINAGGNTEALYIPQLKEMLSANGINEIQKFGFLTIYETGFGKESLSIPDYSLINANLTYSEKDPIYETYGDYVESDSSTAFPFANLDRRVGVETTFDGENLVIKSKPIINSSEKGIFLSEIKESVPSGLAIYLNNSEQLEVKIPISNFVGEDLSQGRGTIEPFNCDLMKAGKVTKQNTGDKIIYSASGNGVSCDFFVYSELSYQNAYVLHLKGENREGRSLKIYLFTPEGTKAYLEELFPGRRSGWSSGSEKGSFDEYFYILPKNMEGEGYTLNLETRSYGSVASENVIEKIEFIPFPYEFLSKVSLGSPEIGMVINNLEITGYKKLNPSQYLVEANGEGLLSLNQGYEEGWRAYEVSKIKNQNEKIKNVLATSFPWWFGQEMPHVKVNSWENGWLINNPSNQVTKYQINIIFWPQYLEWAGLVLAILSLPIILYNANK